MLSASRVQNQDERTAKQINKIIQEWKDKNRGWLLNFSGPIHLVKYDDLLSNVKGTMSKVS